MTIGKFPISCGAFHWGADDHSPRRLKTRLSRRGASVSSPSFRDLDRSATRLSLLEPMSNRNQPAELVIGSASVSRLATQQGRLK
jgi:hypothetical protein